MRCRPDIRSGAVGVLLAVSFVGISGCSDAAPASVSAVTTPPAPTDTSVPSTAAATSTSTIAEAFPVTIAHKYGETTVEQMPERIAVVGLTEQDALLALGVAPVAVTDWFGDHEYAVWPWAQDLLGDAQPVVLDATDGIQFERIAAVEPDLIIGLYAGLTSSEYATLSAIAPTVAQPGEYVDWGIPWQEATRTVGEVVGQAAKADELVKAVEAQFDVVRTEHPEFTGAAAAAATPFDGVWVYGPEDVRGRFLATLGFQMPAGLVDLATDDYGFALSLERLDLLDLDVLLWLDAEDAADAFASNELYNHLDVHTQGREVLLDSEAADALGGATSFVTVLSVPFLLDGLVPKLAAAIDGDPATGT